MEDLGRFDAVHGGDNPGSPGEKPGRGNMVAKGLPIPVIASTAVATANAVLSGFGTTSFIGSHQQLFHISIACRSHRSEAISPVFRHDSGCSQPVINRSTYPWQHVNKSLKSLNPGVSTISTIHYYFSGFLE
jgi:hypothetical protein